MPPLLSPCLQRSVLCISMVYKGDRGKHERLSIMAASRSWLRSSQSSVMSMRQKDASQPVTLEEL